jgi:hypothetical protein
MGESLSIDNILTHYTKNILTRYFPHAISMIILAYNKKYTNKLEYDSRIPLPIKNGNFRFDIFDDKIVFLNEIQHIICVINNHPDSEGNYNWFQTEYTHEKTDVIIVKDIIITTNTGTNNMTIYNHSFHVLNTYGTKGINSGQFDGPTGLYKYDNKIYICDSHNGRIQIYKLESNKFIFLKYIYFSCDIITPNKIIADNDIIYFAEVNKIYLFKDQMKKMIFSSYNKIICFAIENNILFVVIEDNYPYSGGKKWILRILKIGKNTNDDLESIDIAPDVKDIKIYMDKLYLLYDNYIVLFNRDAGS